MITDLSAEADVAIVHARQYATATNATLCVVHSVPHIEAIRPLFPQLVADDLLAAADLPRRAEATLQTRLAALAIDTTATEITIERGTTVDGALQAIERWQPTLVMIGAPDGAVDAVRLVRHLTVPVLVARSSPPTRMVLAGTDLSDPSLPAIRAASEMSSRMGGELVVAHAIEVNPLHVYGVALPPMFGPAAPSVHEAAQQRLDEAVRGLGIEAKTTIGVGTASVVLLGLASARAAELVVVGTHGRTGLTRFVLGSVAETVIRQAPCSVLVVRAA